MASNIAIDVPFAKDKSPHGTICPTVPLSNYRTKQDDTNSSSAFALLPNHLVLKETMIRESIVGLFATSLGFPRSSFRTRSVTVPLRNNCVNMSQNSTIASTLLLHNLTSVDPQIVTFIKGTAPTNHCPPKET
ncbi:MAG: hypothetical protein ACK5PB_13670 [Pirellula sp.]|jgi:hypothetical protein